ncbi:hypothetical protein ACEWY4_013945 [Coilia grayii]|uniref:Integrase core domain-containing protein n=1 Tax=Coilia grayii TaxID=363190 RepID=A0ABD1JXR2_9TELE
MYSVAEERAERVVSGLPHWTPGKTRIHCPPWLCSPYSVECVLRRGDSSGIRRKNYTDLEEVAAFLHSAITGNGRQGYQWLHLRAIQQGYVVSQDTIRQLVKLLDPDGVAKRRALRLSRRQYRNKGPNALWHMDGYDKLKPYGIAISGCIDGFSRYIVWMEAYTTNNDPKVIADYFVSSTARLGGCPEWLHADRGTENGHVENMLIFLRRNHADSFARDRSFLYGRSTANQRIESWLAILRRQSAQFWIDVFYSNVMDISPGISWTRI